ncbi:sensor histidine kinase [Luteipulveratus mongoliensis]|uniref:sensor histidine kinase n=1 Tax=Luteipulveratus mongoliensis TaxID=571913 RepID=UPI000697EAA6|nr:histidine kinase [Luteipulveratus mongoliensis]
MIPYAALVAIAALGVSSLASGLAMLVVRRARTSAILLVCAGCVAIAGAVLDATDHEDPGRALLTCAAALLFPLAVTTYPRTAWRHPVDFVALCVISGAGVLATVQWSNESVTTAMGFTTALALIAHTWWRIERADRETRRTLLWPALAGGAAGLVAGFASFLIPSTVGGTISVAVLVVVPIAMYVGVSRPDVVDVRGLIVQVVVLAVVFIAYISMYVSIESLLEVLGSDSPPPVGVMAVLGAIVATTFHPLRVVLRGVVDELLFGARPDPLGAATQVAGQIGDDPVLALRAIREALVLPYASLRVGDDEVAVTGAPVTHTRTLPLSVGDAGGELVVGLRAGDLTLSSGDEHVLSLVAPLLAQTLRARALATDLHHSRGQTVTALEEERRRLRRDLHDGLGPRLSGIAFTSDAARNSVRANPARAEELLAALRAETGTAIEEIRQLVYGMRPPALDELGLIRALRQQADTLRVADGQPLLVTMTAEDLRLPAAVEVAAYRIVVEGLRNVARHSGSDRAGVLLVCLDGHLTIEIRDHGPDASPWTAGVGLASMRERAAEVGGQLTATPTPDGGLVRAVLPLPG